MSCFFVLFQSDCDVEAMANIRGVVMDSDISSFEVIHSGLVKKMLMYLTVSDIAGNAVYGNITRDERLRAFLHIFMGAPVSMNLILFLFF